MVDALVARRLRILASFAGAGRIVTRSGTGPLETSDSHCALVGVVVA
jgi:hypothetical protein